MLELVQSKDATVAVTPVRRATAATGVLRDSNGSSKATLTGTLDAVDTTVGTVGATTDTFTAASGTGIEPGRWYWYTSANGWTARVRVASRVGAVVTLDAPLPGAQTVGDTFKGLRFAASIAASALATRGRSWRIDWTFTVGSETDVLRESVAVVATRFRDPVTPADAARLAFQGYPSWARAQTPGLWLRISEDANRAVREQLTSVEDFPDRVGDHDAFVPAGEIAVRIELAKLARVPQGYDPSTYIADQERWLAQKVRAAVAGTWVDRDDDLAVDDGEVRSLGTIGIEFT